MAQTEPLNDCPNRPVQGHLTKVGDFSLVTGNAITSSPYAASQHIGG